MENSAELVLGEDLKEGDVLVANKGAHVIGRVTRGKEFGVRGRGRRTREEVARR
jgi:hypothetical protein